jgi:hypothetical protein
MTNLKLYFARFVPKDNKATEFYKVGYTKHYNFMKRFESDEYKPWYIFPLASAWGPEEEVKKAEKELLKKYPKNLYIEQKIKGVTEIFFPKDSKHVQEVFEYFKDKRSQWFNQRNNTLG